MIKVFHIISGLNDGGAEGVLYRICKYDLSCSHIVVSMMDRGKYGLLLDELKIPVYCLNMARGRLSLYGLVKLFFLLREHSPDVVQTWMYHADLVGGILAKLAGIKRICWGVRNSNLDLARSKKSTVMVSKLCSFFSKYIPNKIICCSRNAIEVHADMGYFRERFVFVPNGYDLDLFKPSDFFKDQIKDSFGCSKTLPLVGMVGRFDPQKDHKSLLAALFNIRRRGVGFQCVLVGSKIDNSNAELNGWIDFYGLRDVVFLAGQQSDISKIMNALDVLVLSSCYGEAFPNVLAEAMACGIPCVATDVGDASIIVNGSGWIVPPSNSLALADALNLALNEFVFDKNKWRTRKISSRKHIEVNYSVDRMIKSYHSVWYS